MNEMVRGTAGRELLGEILLRYGSIDAFCDRLRAVLDAPTTVLPAVTVSVPLPGAAGRHRRPESEGVPSPPHGYGERGVRQGVDR